MKHLGRLPVIGVLISDIENAYQGAFYRELCRQTARQGFRPVFYSGAVLGTPVWFERQMNMAYHLAQADHLDAVLVAGSSLSRLGTEPVLTQLLADLDGVPRVSVGPGAAGVPSVTVDNVSGFRQMLEHLVRHHGYRDFAFLSGPAGSDEARQRLKVFRTVMAEASIRVDPRLIQSSEFYYHGARKAAERILASGLPVRAIVASNDEMAMAAVAVAAERGLRVPEDLAVVGVDDVHPHVRSVRLTTVNNALEQQIGLALSALRAGLQGQNVIEQVTVPTRMVRRQSCGCVSDVVSEQSGLDTWTQREAKLMDSLALHGEDKTRYEHYLMQCLNALSSEEPRALERLVWVMARECIARDGDVTHLQTLLLGVQTQLLDPDGLSAQDMWHLGCKLNQAQLTLSRARAMQAVAEGACPGLTAGSVNHLKRQLLSFEVHQQMANLPDLLGQFGIRTCIIAFYDEQGYFNTSSDYLRPATARLVACLIDGQRCNEQLWRPFETRMLLPEPVWDLTGEQPLVVMPVFQQAGHYGYIAFGAEQPVGISLESVREAISSALIGSQMVEEIGRTRDYLARQPKAQVRTSQSIEQIRNHDPVSGLLNRQGFVELATKRLQTTPAGRYVLVHAAVDGLDVVEARLGRADMDAMVGQAARVFASLLRTTDLVARVSERRFVALCAEVEPLFVHNLQTRLDQAFELLNRHANTSYHISCQLICRAVPADGSVALADWLDQPAG